jgi:hypothetical protein
MEPFTTSTGHCHLANSISVHRGVAAIYSEHDGWSDQALTIRCFLAQGLDIHTMG